MPATGPSSRPASKLMGGGAGALAASAAAWPRRFVLANADAMAAASPMPPIMVALSGQLVWAACLRPSRRGSCSPDLCRA